MLTPLINTHPPAPYDTLREQQVIFEGIFTPPTERVPHVRPICSSGECRWQPYGSLAICGGVANLSATSSPELLSRLQATASRRLDVLFNTSQTTDGSGQYGNFFYNAPEVFPIVVGLMDQPSGAFNKSVTDLIVSDSFIAYTEQTVNRTAPMDWSTVQYLEVAFWWCTKTFNTTVRQGEAVTEELAARTQLVGEPGNTFNVPWDAKFYPCYAAGTCNDTYGATEFRLEPPPGAVKLPDELGYTVHLWTEITASMLLASTMLDSLLMDRKRGVVASNGGGVAKAFGFSLLGDFLATELPTREQQMRNTERVVVNTARSMTNL